MIRTFDTEEADTLKKFTALAGVLLLSSSVLVACTPNAAPDNNNRAGNYNTAGNTGRVTDLGTNNNNRAGDRLGVRNIAPNRPNGDPDRLGVRDNFGPDRPGANMRQDRTLESRVETIPGVRNATVLVAGNTAYVAIDQGTWAGNNRGGTTGRAGTAGIGNTGDTRTGTLGTTDGSASRAGAGTMGARTGGATTSLNGTGTRGFDGVTQYGGTMNDRDVTLRNNAGGTTGAGTYATPGRFGTAGTPGTAGTYGTPGNPGTGYYGYNAGVNNNATTYYSNGATGNGVGTSQYGTAGVAGGAGRNALTLRDNDRPVPGQAGTYNTNTTGNARSNNATGTTRGYNVYADNSIPTDIKNQVARVVRQNDATISTVYVSANPALMGRMDAFARDLGAGQPLRGGNDLLDTIRRMFPAAR